MNRLVAVLLGLLIMACGGSRTAQSPSAPASRVAPASSSRGTSEPASSPLPSITPLTSPAAAALDFSCRLPVVWYEPSGADPGVKVGFVTLPAGSVDKDPYQVPASLPAGGGLYYDHGLARWVPAPRGAISPDGLRYAYADYDLPPSPTAEKNGYVLMAGVLATTGRVHVVDVRTGSDRVIYKGSPTFTVSNFSSSGLYLTQVDLTMDGSFSHGLYLMDPAGGSYRAVPGGTRQTDRVGWNVDSGAGWATDFASGGSITPGNRLLRLDLQTGVVTDWLTRPQGQGVELLAFDRSGSPLVHVYGAYGDSQNPIWPGQEIWRLSGPNAAVRVWDWTQDRGPTGAVTDSHGTWFGSSDASVWLYSADAGMRRIATTSGQPLSIAGSCF